MNPVPPFISNSDDDTHCVNAVYRMVLKHYFNEDISWEELDRITKAVPGKGTWTIPGDIWLSEKGLTVRNIEPVNYKELFEKGTGYLTQVFGEQTAQYYLKRSNIEQVLPDIPEFLREVHHETRRTTVGEIHSLLKGGNLIAATVNSAILNEVPGFSLHMVLLYDSDGENIYLHDPGLPPAPARKITSEAFKQCFYYRGGNGGIEVFTKEV